MNRQHRRLPAFRVLASQMASEDREAFEASTPAEHMLKVDAAWFAGRRPDMAAEAERKRAALAQLMADRPGLRRMLSR